MSKSVNIVLNSNNRVNGSTTQVANYFVDWRAILDPRKRYHMHFVFTGSVVTNWNATKIPCLYANFNSTTVQPVNGSTSGTQMLGVLLPYTVSHGANVEVFFQSTDETNLPICLDVIPGGNNLTISILDNAASPQPYADPDVPAPYVLILRFVEIDEYNNM